MLNRSTTGKKSTFGYSGSIPGIEYMGAENKSRDEGRDMSNVEEMDF
jgi:hypothetical protein